MTHSTNSKTHQEYIFLLADRAALHRIIADIPADDVITLGSLQSRLEQVEHEITSVQVEDQAPAPEPFEESSSSATT